MEVMMVKKYGLYVIGCALFVCNAHAAGILRNMLNSKAAQRDNTQNGCIKELQELIAAEGELSEANIRKFNDLFTKCASIKTLALIENAAKSDANLDDQKKSAYINLRSAVAQTILNDNIDKYIAQENHKQATFISELNTIVQAQQQRS